MAVIARTTALAAIVCGACMNWLLAAPLKTAAAVDSPGRPALVLQTGHSDAIVAIAARPDGRLLATAGGDSDGSVKLWSVESGLELVTLDATGARTNSLAFSPDGRSLVAGGADNMVRVWDAANGTLLRTLTGHSGAVTSVVVSPDGRMLASGSGDGTVRLWDVARGDEIGRLDGRNQGINAVAFSPDGSMLAAGGAGKIVSLWDVAGRRETAKLMGHTDYVNALAFSPDGQVLASGSEDRTVRLWSVSKGAPLRVLEGHGSWIGSVAFSGDSRSLATACFDGKVRVLNAATGAVQWTVDAHKGGALAVTIVPATQLIATGGADDTARLWDAVTGSSVRTLGGSVDWVQTVATSVGGRWMASAGAGNSVRVWDVGAGRAWQTLTGHVGRVNALAFSPDEQTLASAGQDGTVRLWDVIAGRLVTTLSGHVNGVTSVAFSRDGRTVASGGLDKTVRLWDVATGRETARLAAHSQKVNAVAFSPDGATVASAGDDNVVILWDARTGARLRTLEGHSIFVTSLAFSPDGRVLASGSADNTIKLWEADTGTLRATLSGHSDSVRSVAFSPDGAALASCGEDRTVRLWSVADGTPRRTLMGHAAWATSVAFGADGRWLVSGSTDGSVRVWDVASGDALATLLAVSGTDDWLVVTPDGLFDGSPAAWSRILWRFSASLFDVAPVEVFFDEYFEPGVLGELLSGRRPLPPVSIAQKDRRQPQLALSVVGGPRAVARTITVRVDVARAPAGARDVRLFRNGSLVHVWRGEVAAGTASLEAAIPVTAGRNELTAYCFNRDNVKSPDARYVVVGDEALRRRGVAYVVVIAVNRYADPEYNLRYAVADAELFAREIEARQKALGQFECVELVTLFDERATRANILAALGGLSRLEPEDTVFVYYAGHGMAHRAHYYMVPHDLGQGVPDTVVGPARVDAFMATCISDDELEVALEGVSAGQVVFVLDSCNSGQVLEAEERRKGPINARGLAQLAYEKGMYVLAAAQGYQAAVEARKLGHGFLTYVLVDEALAANEADRQPVDGRVTVEEWFDFTSARVPELLLKKDEKSDTRGLVLGSSSDAAASTGRDVQRPRSYYRSRTEAEAFVVSGAGAR